MNTFILFLTICIGLISWLTKETHLDLDEIIKNENDTNENKDTDKIVM